MLVAQRRPGISRLGPTQALPGRHISSPAAQLVGTIGIASLSVGIDRGDAGPYSDGDGSRTKPPFLVAPGQLIPATRT